MGKARFATVSISYQLQIKRINPSIIAATIGEGALVTKSPLVSTRPVTNIAVPTMRVHAYGGREERRGWGREETV